MVSFFAGTTRRFASRAEGARAPSLIFMMPYAGRAPDARRDIT